MKFEKKARACMLWTCADMFARIPALYQESAGKNERGRTAGTGVDNASSGESISAMCESIGNESSKKYAKRRYTWKIRKIAA